MAVELEKIVKELKLEVRCCKDRLSRPVSGGYVGDLLSDVMANSREGDIWITRQIHQNTVAVASLKEHAAVIFVNGSEPTAETVSRAEQEGIPLLVSSMPGFEVVGRIYKVMNP